MASKNIVAKGTTYNGVESVTFPVSGGGNATFYEVSDTTAGASDVASGKYFYTSSGVKTEGTASGGGGGDAWTWMGKNPTKVSTLANEKTYLKDTGYASWTPSTSASSIIAVSTIPNNTLSLNYDAVLLLKAHTHFEYDATATNKAQINDYYFVGTSDLTPLSSDLANATTDTRNGVINSPTATSRTVIDFLNTSGVNKYLTGTQSAYGVYVSSWYPFPSATAQNGSVTFSVETPAIYAKCNSSYFSTANGAAVDQNTSYIEYTMELWRVDLDSANLGAIAEMARDMWYDNL